MTYFGIDPEWGTQARFGFIAKDEVEILRLEVFAKKNQLYNQVILLCQHDELSLDDANLSFLGVLDHEALLKVVTKHPEKESLSYFNDTHHIELKPTARKT